MYIYIYIIYIYMYIIFIYIYVYHVYHIYTYIIHIIYIYYIYIIYGIYSIYIIYIISIIYISYISYISCIYIYIYHRYLWIGDCFRCVSGSYGIDAWCRWRSVCSFGHGFLFSESCSSWILSQRCIDMYAPWLEVYYCTCGDSVLYCGWIPIRTPHAWLILSVTRRRVNLNFSICRFTFVELERVESSFRTTRLRCGLLHSLQKKWSVHMHADKTWSMYSIEVHLTRRSQRQEFHSSMIKPNKMDYWARSLPSRSCVIREVDRCRDSALMQWSQKKRCGSQISRLRFLSEVIYNDDEVNHEQWLLFHAAKVIRTYAEVNWTYRLYPHP